MTEPERGADPDMAASANAATTIRVPLRIRYCTQCRWLARASWVAQELLTTFPIELEVTLEPGFGGVFEVELDGALIFSRAGLRRFPEPKELKIGIGAPGIP
jgi:selenoprotein W-related protein